MYNAPLYSRVNVLLLGKGVGQLGKKATGFMGVTQFSTRKRGLRVALRAVAGGREETNCDTGWKFVNNKVRLGKLPIFLSLIESSHSFYYFYFFLSFFFLSFIRISELHCSKTCGIYSALLVDGRKQNERTGPW